MAKDSPGKADRGGIFKTYKGYLKRLTFQALGYFKAEILGVITTIDSDIFNSIGLIFGLNVLLLMLLILFNSKVRTFLGDILLGGSSACNSCKR